MNQQRAQLKILATTDLHAHVTNYDYYRDEVVADFGLIGLADVIQGIRKNHPNTLLLDNGDFLQGNPMGNYLQDYSLDNEHPIVTIMNQLQYDVGTLGNHEFDFGIDYLANMLSDLQYPIVNANIVDPDGKTWLKPYVLLNRLLRTDNDETLPIKIGVIGALPPQVALWNHKVFSDYAQNHSALKVEDILDALNHYIPIMKSEGADIIIVLAHSGFSERPYESGAENVIQFLAHDVEGVDVIIAGHAHGVFPDHQHAFDLPIVMPGCFGQYLGVVELNLVYDDHQQWSVVESDVQLIKNQNHEQLSHELFTPISAAHDIAISRMNTAIGENQTLFSSAFSLIQDDPCTQLIADAQLWYAHKLICELGDDQYHHLPILSAAPVFKVGGRKNAPHDYSWVDEGQLTFKNVADIYPFNNQLALMTLTGRELKEWLECANSIYHQINDNDEPQYLINWEKHRGYNRDVVKGITYDVNVSQSRRYNGDCQLIHPHSERITNLCYQGRCIQDDEQFILVTNQYRAYSGRFPGSGEDKVITLSNEEIPTLIALYLQEMIKTQGDIQVSPSQNWRLQLNDANNIIYESIHNEDIQRYIHDNNTPVIFTHKYDEKYFALYKINPHILL